MPYANPLVAQAHRRWRNMISRCTNPNDKQWKWYGARGITVCNAWLDFWTYYTDTGDRPFPKASIDRVDNDGPYSPDNWRWATAMQQIHNRRPDHRTLRDECSYGHPFTPENTQFQPVGSNRRICGECRRIRDRRRRPRKAAA